MDLSHNCSLHGGMSEVCENEFKIYLKINQMNGVSMIDRPLIRGTFTSCRLMEQWHIRKCSLKIHVHVGVPHQRILKIHVRVGVPHQRIP